MLIKGPVSLWALLITEYEKGSTSFLQAVLDDLHYLWIHVYIFRDLPDPRSEFGPWKSLLCDLPGSCLKAAAIQGETETQNITALAAVPSPVHLEYSCHIRGDEHNSKQELSAQLFEKHGIKILLRRKIDTTYCLSCLTEFHTRTKLINHISYRCPPCAHYYLHHVDELDPSITDPLDLQESIDNTTLRSLGKAILFHPGHSFKLFGPRPFNLFY